MRPPEPRTVRPAVAADTRAVTDLVRLAYEPYVPRIGRPPAPMTVDYEQAIADAAVWVVDADDRIVGVVVLRDAPDHLLIENVAVHPDEQGRGLGSALLAYAEARARILGRDDVQLYTHELMIENVTYYRHRGYEEVARRTEDGFRRVFFRKILT